jgi:hypothetical protein
MKTALLITIATLSSLAAAEVTCETVQTSIKKIRCKYLALAQEKPRQVTFKWVSPDNKADNRTKVHTIPPGHISVFDYRYFSGRSEGKWTISVTENSSQKSVSTEYLKDSNAEVMIESTDPLLKKH